MSKLFLNHDIKFYQSLSEIKGHQHLEGDIIFVFDANKYYQHSGTIDGKTIWSERNEEFEKLWNAKKKTDDNI